jgi:anhydro-N-acetylmuramic acid kinase
MLNLNFKVKTAIMHYRIIGLMSGTSMDGLDIACVDLQEKSSNHWNYKVCEAYTANLPVSLQKKLAQAKQLNGLELSLLNNEFGEFSASSVLDFLAKYSIDKQSIHAIASHGFTVFHQTQRAFTLQIGNGNIIAHRTGIATICNFREKDVLNGGQGAPLVPIGDKYLFSNWADSFLNLGGFANISCINTKGITAFDVGPCNLILNHFAQQLGFEFDKNGDLGRNTQEIDEHLLQQLNNLDYYAQKGPKSLGTEWLDTQFMPILNANKTDILSQLKTCYVHLAMQIGSSISRLNPSKTMVTGGGAKNKYLIQLIQKNTESPLIFPEEKIIDFKEAIVFALLGALFLENKPNCLSKVTGSNHDTVGGVLYKP